jgi:glycerol-3-phosphate dehydrogenase subunit B
MEHIDVLVVGGGAAGTAAALAATAAGARTTLLRAGPGATALAAGGWIGAPPAGLLGALAAAGLPLQLLQAGLPHPDGRVIPCDAAPASHASARVTAAELGSAAPESRALVCGIAGLAAFRASSLAVLWTEASGSAAHMLVPTVIEVAGTPAAGWSPVALAAALERDPALLSHPLARAVRAHGASRVILPAVLGLEEHARTAEAVAADTGVEVGEALATAPSLPGWRLDRALLRALEHAGIRLLHGRVSDHTVAGGRVERVVVRQPDGDNVRLAIGALVLATGRFIGGGVVTEPRLADSVLGLPLSIERAARSFTDPSESLALTDPVRLEPQPLLEAGLRTDELGAVLAPPGSEQTGNVFAAGSVRHGLATAALGLGHAARDGWAAGAHAAAAAGAPA